MTEAERKRKKKHFDKNYSMLSIRIPKGSNELLHAAAKEAGAKSTAAYIGEAVLAYGGPDIRLMNDLPHLKKD